ncbi:hypothetical protein KIW84_045417 [Lathyrus oleraceus]|uniref:ATXR3 GYF domain-containing protein n=1 Tax=Pisum sativum TaxID=3888 RepID=A0A9D4XL32_PEA|nr:hypothetical protein KIW84_045417 [Pisum sativum]
MGQQQIELPTCLMILRLSPQRQHSHKLRSPARVEQLLEDQARHHDHRDCTLNLVEGSHLDQTRKDVHDETSCKQNSPNSCKSDEDKTFKESRVFQLQNLEKSCSPTIDLKESPHLEPQPPPDELLSMEEDMDICDTPPHVPVVTDLSSGKCFYLDYRGVENGPAKLCDIKFLVDEGVLMSDHFIKHLDSDRWLTVENAVSPLAAQSFPSIVSDTITQHVLLQHQMQRVLRKFTKFRCTKMA